MGGVSFFLILSFSYICTNHSLFFPTLSFSSLLFPLFPFYLTAFTFNSFILSLKLLLFLHSFLARL